MAPRTNQPQNPPTMNTVPNTFRPLMIPSCPAVEASEVARKLKQAAYGRTYYAAHRDQTAAAKKAWVLANPERAAAAKKAWRTANPEKQGQYQRTYLESLKLKAAAVQPAPVEVILSDLVQQVAELKALVLQLVTDRQQSTAITGSSLPITKPQAAAPVSTR